jgi:hypothetical protein
MVLCVQSMNYQKTAADKCFVLYFKIYSFVKRWLNVIVILVYINIVIPWNNQITHIETFEHYPGRTSILVLNIHRVTTHCHTIEKLAQRLWVQEVGIC